MALQLPLVGQPVPCKPLELFPVAKNSGSHNQGGHKWGHHEQSHVPRVHAQLRNLQGRHQLLRLQSAMDESEHGHTSSESEGGVVTEGIEVSLVERVDDSSLSVDSPGLN